MWHTDLEFFLIFLRHNIKKAHLACHSVLLFLINAINDLHVYRHFLSAVPFQTIHRSGLDQILHNTLVQLNNITLHKIFQ